MTSRKCRTLRSNHVPRIGLRHSSLLFFHFKFRRLIPAKRSSSVETRLPPRRETVVMEVGDLAFIPQNRPEISPTRGFNEENRNTKENQSHQRTGPLAVLLTPLQVDRVESRLDVVPR